MIRSISAANAAQNKFLIEGPGPKAWIHTYINDGRQRPDGSPRIAGEPSPMIYLVDQEPNSEIQVHFHQVDQYQVFVGGSGAMGHQPLAPVTLHYTRAYTGYGPLRSGPDGLQYLTIRSQWDPGLRPLPEARNELPPAGTFRMRQRTTDPSPAFTSATLATLTEPKLRRLIDDGDAASWMLALPPNGVHADPANNVADRVVVICSGTLTGTTANDPMACHFIPAGYCLDFTAGSSGADVLILQFPKRTAK